MKKRDFSLFVKIMLYLWTFVALIALIWTIILLPTISWLYSTYFIVFSVTLSVLYVVTLLLILKKKFLGIVIFYGISIIELISRLFDSSLGSYAIPIYRVIMVSSLLLIRKNRKSGWKLLLLDLRHTIKKRRSKMKKDTQQTKMYSEKQDLLINVEDFSVSQDDVKHDDIIADKEYSTTPKESVLRDTNKDEFFYEPKKTDCFVSENMKNDIIDADPPTATNNVYEKEENPKIRRLDKKEKLLISTILLLFILSLGSVVCTLLNRQSIKDHTIEIEELKTLNEKHEYSTSFIQEVYNAYRGRYGDAANTYERFADVLSGDEKARKTIYDDLRSHGDLDDTWDYEGFTEIFTEEYNQNILPARQNSSSVSTKKDQIVFISLSKSAYAYHKRIDCDRLRLSKTISKIPLSEALILNREPCSVCYGHTFIGKNIWLITTLFLLVILILLNFIILHKKR